MSFLILSQPVTIALIVWYLHVRDGRQIDATARLMALIDTDRAAHRQEVQTLLQRIQAPERAVIAHYEDDGAQATSPYPLSEEEIVQAQDDRLKALAMIEQAERDELRAGSLLG